MTTRWPSISLTIILLFGIGLCFKSFDLLLLNELKVIVSIMFGFATSSLILSFIWLIKKESSLPSISLDYTQDTPVMHPRGRSASDNVSENRRRITVCTISSLIDEPPEYEDALVNSKPVNWQLNRNSSEKTDPIEAYESTSGHLLVECQSKSAALCDRLQNNLYCPKHTIVNTERSEILNMNPSSNNMAQLALSIVRGFTTLELNNQQQSDQQVRRSRFSHDNGTDQHRRDSARQGQDIRRKFSYCQLDVSQLIVSESPPRYCDLPHGDNDSNEPTAGNH